jgi:hypothetical protein
MRARTHDPTTAQFLSHDPLQSITRAPYYYAEDDPVDYFDPTGLSCSFNPVVSSNCFSEIPGAIGKIVNSGVEWAGENPVEAGGLALGAVSLGTGVGEVAAGADAAGNLGIVSAGTGAGAFGADISGCVRGDDVACVGAGVGAAAVGGAFAGVAGLTAGPAVGLPSGFLAFLSDLANAVDPAGASAEGCP